MREANDASSKLISNVLRSMTRLTGAYVGGSSLYKFRFKIEGMHRREMVPEEVADTYFADFVDDARGRYTVIARAGYIYRAAVTNHWNVLHHFRFGVCLLVLHIFVAIETPLFTELARVSNLIACRLTTDIFSVLQEV